MWGWKGGGRGARAHLQEVILRMTPDLNHRLCSHVLLDLLQSRSYLRADEEAGAVSAPRSARVTQHLVFLEWRGGSIRAKAGNAQVDSLQKHIVLRISPRLAGFGDGVRLARLAGGGDGLHLGRVDDV